MRIKGWIASKIKCKNGIEAGVSLKKMFKAPKIGINNPL